MKRGALHGLSVNVALASGPREGWSIFSYRAKESTSMLLHADMAGADAVIRIRYDANELMKGVTEVPCY